MIVYPPRNKSVNGAKTDKQIKWRKLKLTAALASRDERVSLNYEARVRLQAKRFKQTFHHHSDNFISFPLINRFVGVRCVLTKLRKEN